MSDEPADGPVEKTGDALRCVRFADARNRAVATASMFGMIGGEHHKQWVIDQMVRSLLGEKDYDEWVQHMNADPDYEPWDTGTAP